MHILQAQKANGLLENCSQVYRNSAEGHYGTSGLLRYNRKCVNGAQSLSWDTGTVLGIAY